MKNIFKANLLLVSIMVISFLFQISIAFFIPKQIGDYLDQYIMLLIPCIIFILFNKKNIKSTLKLNRLSRKELMSVILVAILIQPIVIMIAEIGAMIFGAPIAEYISEIQSYGFLPMIIIVGITPAICEEVLFRGVVLEGYSQYSPLKAALFNGLLFGAFHANFQQFFYTFIMGIILALVVQGTNSIYSGMIIHLINNTWSDIWTQISPKSFDATMNFVYSGGIYGRFIWLIVGIISMFGVVKIIGNLFQEKTQTSAIYYEGGESFSNWPFWTFIGMCSFISILMMIGQ